jgi:NADH-quinone oxidoreductase subunit N
MRALAQAAEASTFRGPEIQWFALSPLLVLLGGTLFLMVVSALSRRTQVRGSFAIVTVTTSMAAMILAFFLWDDVRDEGPISLVGGAVGLDGFTLFLTVAICAAIALSALLADDYLRREGLEEPLAVEFNALLMLSGLGGIVMASANDLIVLFLGLETLSIALYALAASHLKRIDSQESAIKYFVLGGFSSAFFLYGVALTYGATGTTSLIGIRDFLAANVLVENGLLLAGLGLMLVGLAFKVAAAPFHVWTPDVYQGSPTPATAFMATAAKAAGFAAMLRVFVVTFDVVQTDWRPVMWVLAVLTLVVGAVLAVVQTDVKRMLAYSSISHAGFILVGVVMADPDGTAAALFYLLAYTFMVVGTFGILTVIGRTGDTGHSLASLKGLAKKKPVLALAFTVFLFAQAGIPPSTGFMAKFFVITSAAERDEWLLAVIAMVSAAIAAFLYLRIIVSMYLQDADSAGDGVATGRTPVSAGLALIVAAAFTVVFGIFPNPVIEFARDAVPALVSVG